MSVANEHPSNNSFQPTWMRSTFNAAGAAAAPLRGGGGGGGGSYGIGGGIAPDLSENDYPLAPPVFVPNRYGREDLLALASSGRANPPPDGLSDCILLFTPIPQQPIVCTPLSETEEMLQSNINSSKAIASLSAAERQKMVAASPQQGGGGVGGGGGGGMTPDRAGQNAWQQVKPWGRSGSSGGGSGGTPSAFSSVIGGRGGGVGGGTNLSGGGGGGRGGAYSATRGGVNGGGGGVGAVGEDGSYSSRFIARRGAPASGRGGGTANTTFNSRAQGLYNPRDPKDRPRQRMRSTSEEDAANTAASAGGQNGWQQSGGGNAAKPSAWTRPLVSASQTATMDSSLGGGGGGAGGGRVTEWMNDDEKAEPSARDSLDDSTSGSFDDNGHFRSDRSASRPSGSPPAAAAAPQQPASSTPASAVPSAEYGENTRTEYASSVVGFGAAAAPPATAAAPWGDASGGVGGYGGPPQHQHQHQQHHQQQQQHFHPAPQPPVTTLQGTMPVDIPQLHQQQPILDGSSSSVAAINSPNAMFYMAQLQQQLAAQQQQQQPPPPPPPPANPPFYYLDPNKVERGPFEKVQMDTWYSMGYFANNLEVRRDCDTEYIQLGQLITRNGTRTPFDYKQPEILPMPPQVPPVSVFDRLGLGLSGLWNNVPAGAPFGTADITPQQMKEFILEQQRKDDMARRQQQEGAAAAAQYAEMLREAEQQRIANAEREAALRRQQEEIERREQEVLAAKREAEAERIQLEENRRQIEEQRRKVEEEENRKRDEAERIRRAKEDEEQRKAAAAAAEEERRIKAEEAADRERERLLAAQEEAKLILAAKKKQDEEEARRLKEEQAKRAAEEEEKRKAAAKAAAAASANPSGPQSISYRPESKATGKEAAKKTASSGPAWGGGAGAASAAPAVVQPIRSTVPPPPAPTTPQKSLREIQLEQERQLKAERRENEAMRRAQQEAMSAAVPTNWANAASRISWGNPAPVVANTPASAWGGAGHSSSSHSATSPFWDGPSLESANRSAAAKPVAKVVNKKADDSKAKAKEKEHANLKKVLGVGVSSPSSTSVASSTSSTSQNPKEKFDDWLVRRVQQLNDTVDAEVLATFIGSVESPDEVEDFLVGYLGESKQVKELVRELLERRSQMRNRKLDNTGKDDLSRAGAAVAPPTSAGAAKTKKKKGKGTQLVVDGACLGFRATSNPNRTNQGEIERLPEAAAGRR